MPTLPPVILFDLDDTIIDNESSGQPAACWLATLEAHSPQLGGISPATAFASLERTRTAFWSDQIRAAELSLDLRAASTLVIRSALADLGLDLDEKRALAIADDYRAMRDLGLRVFDGAIEALVGLRERGTRLGLVTNGASPAQRAKIARFDLEPHFEHIQISGELGHGKPSPEAYAFALTSMQVSAGDAWFVGDNLEWDVAAPQRAGMIAIWVDHGGNGTSSTSGVTPDRVVSHIREISNPA